MQACRTVKQLRYFGTYFLISNKHEKKGYSQMKIRFLYRTLSHKQGNIKSQLKRKIIGNLSREIICTTLMILDLTERSDL